MNILKKFVALVGLSTTVALGDSYDFEGLEHRINDFFTANPKTEHVWFELPTEPDGLAILQENMKSLSELCKKYSRKTLHIIIQPISLAKIEQIHQLGSVLDQLGQIENAEIKLQQLVLEGKAFPEWGSEQIMEFINPFVDVCQKHNEISISLGLQELCFSSKENFEELLDLLKDVDNLRCLIVWVYTSEEDHSIGNPTICRYLSSDKNPLRDYHKKVK